VWRRTWADLVLLHVVLLSASSACSDLSCVAGPTQTKPKEMVGAPAEAGEEPFRPVAWVLSRSVSRRLCYPHAGYSVSVLSDCYFQ